MDNICALRDRSLDHLRRHCSGCDASGATGRSHPSRPYSRWQLCGARRRGSPPHRPHTQFKLCNCTLHGQAFRFPHHRLTKPYQTPLLEAALIPPQQYLPRILTEDNKGSIYLLLDYLLGVSYYHRSSSSSELLPR